MPRPARYKTTYSPGLAGTVSETRVKFICWAIAAPEGSAAIAGAADTNVTGEVALSVPLTLTCTSYCIPGESSNGT
jgi:hypothetical protein